VSTSFGVKYGDIHVRDNCFNVMEIFEVVGRSWQLIRVDLVELS